MVLLSPNIGSLYEWRKRLSSRWPQQATSKISGAMQLDNGLEKNLSGASLALYAYGIEVNEGSLAH